MRTTCLVVLLAALFLSAASGCATTRTGQSSFYRPADYYSSKGGYRPWNDVNTGGLPPLGFLYSDPTVRLPPP